MKLSAMYLFLLVVVTSMALISCTPTHDQQAQRPISVREQKSSRAELPEIIGGVWRLVQIQESNDRTIVIDDPDKYTLQLVPDGTVRIRADCNRGFGTYTMTGREISFSKTAYTRAACPPGSLFDVYTRNLEKASSYVVEGDKLHITCGIDASILKFAK